MTPLEVQFEILKSEFPTAHIQKLPSGAALIWISDFPLVNGWRPDKTVIKFLAPVGYPFAKPDCFWTSQEVRLKNGAMPQNSAINFIPENPQINEMNLWFSWHAGQWNPNRDNLSTYVHVIENRFRDPR